MKQKIKRCPVCKSWFEVDWKKGGKRKYDKKKCARKGMMDKMYAWQKKNPNSGKKSRMAWTKRNIEKVRGYQRNFREKVSLRKKNVALMKGYIPKEFKQYENEILKCYVFIRKRCLHISYKSRGHMVYAICRHLDYISDLGFGRKLIDIFGFRVCKKGEKHNDARCGNKLYKKIKKENAFPSIAQLNEVKL